jgi:Restriction endonuclease
MQKKIRFEVKEKMVALTGACFWYWNNFYSFLDSCGVSRTIYKLYPKETYNKYDVMRSIIEYLENKNDVETINNMISNFYKMKNAIDKDNLNNQKAQELLEEFRIIVGTDPIENEIKKQQQQKHYETRERNIQVKQNFEQNIENLNKEFFKLATSNELTPQQRGYKLEELFFELLRINEFKYSNPYKKNGEQIDGHFIYEKFDYLVELKWTKDTTKQKDLSIFDGKIRGKLQSTRGLFLAANGFDENAVIKFSGDSPRIILMDGEDLSLILNGTFSLFDALKIKVDAIVRHGEIYYHLRKAL